MENMNMNKKKKKKMKIVVPEITQNSSLHDLTFSLFYSFEETDLELVQGILTTRENVFKEEIQKHKRILQDLVQQRIVYEENMKEKYDVLEKEGEILRGQCEYLVDIEVELDEKMKEKFDALEKERELKRKVLEEEVENLKGKCEELERNHEKELKKSLMQNEGVRKELEGKLEKARGMYEEELKREIDFVAQSKREVEDLMQSRVDFEEKMKEKFDVLAKEGELKRKVLEEEVERLREQCEYMIHMKEELEEKMKGKCDVLGKEVESLRVQCEYLKDVKVEFEEKMKEKSDILEKEGESKRKVLEEEIQSLKGKCEELERNHEKELKKSLMQKEEVRKELEGELEKAKKNYEEELKRERDLRENNLALAELEKMNLEEELKKSRKNFEERIQVLEVKNLELYKKEEQHIESFLKINSFAQLIKGASDSFISGNVNVHEPFSNGSDAGEKASNVEGRLVEYPVSPGEPLPETILQTEVKCLRGKHTDIQLGEKTEDNSLLENDAEDRGCSENNINCKRKRSINETEDAKDSTASNKMIKLFQTDKEIKWEHPADMLSAFGDDPELFCLAAVCALYRQTISSRSGGFRSCDSVRFTAIAKYLINNDPENKLSRSLLEVQQNRPSILRSCQTLADQYSQELLTMYQKKLDPFFCPMS